MTAVDWKRLIGAVAEAVEDVACEIRHQMDVDAVRDSVSGAAAVEPVDGPTVAATSWMAVFAKDVKQGDLIALDGRYLDAGRPGVRALRVTKLESGERTSMLGSTSDVVSMLLMDVDSEEPASVSAPLLMAFRVAAAVPDSLAGLSGDEP